MDNLTLKLLDSFDRLAEDYYNDLYTDMYWNGTDRRYLYHGSEIKDEALNGIRGDVAYFSDSRYDAEGYGPYIIKIKKNELKIQMYDKDPLHQDIPQGKDGIGYPKGICHNYILRTDSVNGKLEAD